jgi:hypothetical protein
MGCESRRRGKGLREGGGVAGGGRKAGAAEKYRKYSRTDLPRAGPEGREKSEREMRGEGGEVKGEERGGGGEGGKALSETENTRQAIEFGPQMKNN